MKSLHELKELIVGSGEWLQTTRALVLPLKDPSVLKASKGVDGWEGLEKSPDALEESRSDAEPKVQSGD